MTVAELIELLNRVVAADPSAATLPVLLEGELDYDETDGEARGVSVRPSRVRHATEYSEPNLLIRRAETREGEPWEWREPVTVLVPKSDLRDEFDAYRTKAERANEGPFAALSAGYDALNAFIKEDWPEVAPALAAGATKWREVARGHVAGSLCELSYEVGTEALGRRVYDMLFNRDSMSWVPVRRP